MGFVSRGVLKPSSSSSCWHDGNGNVGTFSVAAERDSPFTVCFVDTCSAVLASFIEFV